MVSVCSPGGAAAYFNLAVGQKCYGKDTQNSKYTMESTIKNKVTVQGVGSPVPAGLRGEQAGPHSSSSHDCNASTLENLAVVADKVTSVANVDVNPFARRPKLSISPTRGSGTIDTPKTTKPSNLDIYANNSSDYQEMLGRKIVELVNFVNTRKTVHLELRTMVSSLANLHRLAERQRDKRVKATNATQTSPTQKNYGSEKTSGEKVGEIAATPASKRKRSPRQSEEKSTKKSAWRRNRVDQGEQALQTAVKNPLPVTKDVLDSQSFAGDKTPWTKVEKKRVANKPKQRARPDAIVIKQSGEISYADILKRVKSEPALKELGNNVSRIRRTAKGELLMQLDRNGGTSSAVLQLAVTKALGSAVEVKALTDEKAVEIRDLDEITTKEELCFDIGQQFEEAKGIRVEDVKSLRPSYSGTQTAILRLPAKLVDILLNAGKVKIGWVMCRIRSKASITRCYKCLNFGHISRNCPSATDRSNMCYKCEEVDHVAKNCSNELNCILCRENYTEGDLKHAAGSSRCPVYQKAAKRQK